MTQSTHGLATAANHPPPRPQPAGARRWWALALICAAQFMLILDVTVVNVALPTIDAELGLGAQLGWVIAAYSLPFGALLIVGGIITDRIGLRTSFLIGLAVFTLASLGASAASAAGVLIAARVAQALGAALLSPAALSMVISLFEGAARHRALAVWAGIGGAGAAIGAVVGGVLTQLGGWRWAFLVNVPVGLLIGVLVLLVIRTAMLVRSEHGGAPAHPVVSTLRLLGTRSVAGGAITMLLASMFLIGSFFVLTIALQDGAGVDPLGAGLAFLPAAVAVVLGAQLAAHLLGRMTARAVGAIAFGTVVAGFAIAWLLPDSLPALIIGVGVAALGIGPALVTATATATTGVSHGESGAASGVVNTMHEIGGGLGVLMASMPMLVALSAAGDTAVFGYAAAGAVLAGVIVALALPHGRIHASGGMHH
ncbi:hypothetical protein GCM10023169_33000 [Georgenia halophila]|uniref:Major facilitator superfamily (MFS) profile domain-containing protein n=1 Tax=Georgenia halophila TaxID=620889 RepID=A0ABP8LHW1_9MICO